MFVFLATWTSARLICFLVNDDKKSDDDENAERRRTRTTWTIPIGVQGALLPIFSRNVVWWETSASAEDSLPLSLRTL